MITALIIMGYIVAGTIVGKLMSNAFLKHQYDQEISHIKESNYTSHMKKSYETYEDYVLDQKTRAYETALRDSELDRQLSMVMCLIFWPAAVTILIGYYIYNAYKKIPKLKNLGLNAAGRDVRKTEKNLNKIKTAKALENSKIDEWNNMVDILNENGLNDITKYEKKVK